MARVDSNTAVRLDLQQRPTRFDDDCGAILVVSFRPDCCPVSAGEEGAANYFLALASFSASASICDRFLLPATQVSSDA
jgi:hypothetical protein